MKAREAFTIIEVLISVVLISIVALGAVKLQQESRNMALYLSDRSKYELSNTLFLGKEVFRYHKEKKDAYTLLERSFKVKDFKSRDTLKNIHRNIFISDPLEMPEGDAVPVRINEILLKDRFPARYLHFEIQ